jgi:hypothetical protein
MTDDDQPKLVSTDPLEPGDLPTVIIRVSDQELHDAGWLVETKDPSKLGWEERYLDALAASGSKVESADKAGVTVRYVNRRIQTDAGFAALADDALARSNALLEDTLRDHALNGVPTTYTNKRGQTISTRKHDPRMLIEVSRMLVPYLRNQDERRAALEGGIIVKLQIEGKGAPELPPASIDGEADEITDAEGDDQ